MKNTQQSAPVFSCALDIVARQHRLNLPNCVLFRRRTGGSKPRAVTLERGS